MKNIFLVSSTFSCKKPSEISLARFKRCFFSLFSKSTSCICFVLLLFEASITHSQIKKLWVIDSLTGLPIEGVTMFANQNFYYSDSSGLILPKVSEGDLIWFKRMDYEQLWSNYNDNEDTIRMLKKSVFLNQVNVYSNSSQSKLHEIGYYNMRRTTRRTSISNSLCIIAVYVPSYQTNSYIDKILLSLKSRKFAEDYYVYLYEPNSSGKPGKTLYKKHILADSLKKEGVIDVHALNIKVPERGIFIGLENTKKYNYSEHNPLMGMGIRYKCLEKMDSGLTCILFKDFKDNSKNNVWSSPPQFYTPCFGLEVYQK